VIYWHYSSRQEFNTLNIGSFILFENYEAAVVLHEKIIGTVFIDFLKGTYTFDYHNVTTS